MKIALANYVDLIRAENGDIPSDSVRRFEVDGIVDTGAAQLVLPASAAAALGLDEAWRAKVSLQVKVTLSEPSSSSMRY